LPALRELRPVPQTPAEGTLARLRSFVSPLAGVVHGLSETLAAPGEFRLVSIGCELAEGLPTIGAPLESYTGSEHWSRSAAEAAILTGLLEVVERDAFMLAWHNRLSLPRLDWSGDPELVRLDRRYFATSGLRYSAVDLSVFLDVPTVLGVVHGPAQALGALGVGAASAPSVADAW